MHDERRRLFLPGFGARAHAYGAGLPHGWAVVQPPALTETRGSLALLGDWLVREIRDDRDPAVLAGHSMGGALALIAAAQAPERVHRLVLIAPAGLPLAKPVRASLADFVRQLASGVYAVSDVLASARELARAPRATMRLARTLRRLDLSEPMARIRRAGVPVTLVGCDSDTLVTPALSRHMADLLDADYRELQLTGGHVWMLRRPERLSSLLGSVG